MHVLFIIYCTKLEIEIKQAMFIMRQAVLSMYIVFISFNNVYKQQKYACMCRLNPLVYSSSIAFDLLFENDDLFDNMIASPGELYNLL